MAETLHGWAVLNVGINTGDPAPLSPPIAGPDEAGQLAAELTTFAVELGKPDRFVAIRLVEPGAVES